MAEISKMLVLSTANLSPETLAYLNSTPAVQWPFSANPIDYGFLLYAHDERPEDAPDDIWAICQAARRNGCDYVKLDSDAEPLEGLTLYDHA